MRLDGHLHGDDEDEGEELVHLVHLATQADGLVGSQVHGLDEERAEEETQAQVVSRAARGAEDRRRFEYVQHGAEEEQHYGQQVYRDERLTVVVAECPFARLHQEKGEGVQSDEGADDGANEDGQRPAPSEPGGEGSARGGNGHWS